MGNTAPCPYCGAMQTELNEAFARPYDGQEVAIECDDCCGTFFIVAHVTHEYTIRPRNNKEAAAMADTKMSEKLWRDCKSDQERAVDVVTELMREIESLRKAAQPAGEKP